MINGGAFRSSGFLYWLGSRGTAELIYKHKACLQLKNYRMAEEGLFARAHCWCSDWFVGVQSTGTRLSYRTPARQGSK